MGSFGVLHIACVERVARPWLPSWKSTNITSLVCKTTVDKISKEGKDNELSIDASATESVKFSRFPSTLEMTNIASSFFFTNKFRLQNYQSMKHFAWLWSCHFLPNGMRFSPLHRSSPVSPYMALLVNQVRTFAGEQQENSQPTVFKGFHLGRGSLIPGSNLSNFNITSVVNWQLLMTG